MLLRLPSAQHAGYLRAGYCSESCLTIKAVKPQTTSIAAELLVRKQYNNNENNTERRQLGQIFGTDSLLFGWPNHFGCVLCVCVCMMCVCCVLRFVSRSKHHKHETNLSQETGLKPCSQLESRSSPTREMESLSLLPSLRLCLKSQV